MSLRCKIAGFLMITLAGIFSVYGQGNVPVQSADERYRIGFQDALEVQVFGHPNLTQRVRVNSNGTVNLFRLALPIYAVCKTERQLADDIAEAYKKDYLRNPEVNVFAVEQFSQSFSDIGAVEKPGHYLSIAKYVCLSSFLLPAAQIKRPAPE
ncbi:MAG: polysaccharide biosynthesis/export family protein [Blastocatellia bacterium]